jgi:hypothetical protein
MKALEKRRLFDRIKIWQTRNVQSQQTNKKLASTNPFFQSRRFERILDHEDNSLRGSFCFEYKFLFRRGERNSIIIGIKTA